MATWIFENSVVNINECFSSSPAGLGIHLFPWSFAGALLQKFLQGLEYHAWGKFSSTASI